MMSWRAIIVCLAGLSLQVGPVYAQSPSGNPDGLTVAALQRQIKSVQNNTELPAALRDKILVYLQDAVERLELAQEQIGRADQWTRRLSLVPDALTAAKQRLAVAPKTANLAIVAVENVDELERIVDTQSRQLDDSENGLRKRVAKLDDDADKWRIRPEKLVTELADVEDRLHEIDDEIDALATSGEPRELLIAHRTLLLARRQRAENERHAIQAEAAWFESAAASELFEIQRELATQELAVKTAELELLEAELDKRRGDEADRRVRQAELVVTQSAAEIQSVASENLVLATERREISRRLIELEHRHEATTMTLDELEKEFDRTKKMVNDVGLTDSIGLLLRQRRARLANPRRIAVNLAHSNEQVRETRMRLFQLDADHALLVDLDIATTRRAKELGLDASRTAVTANLKSLLDEQRQLVKGLDGDHTRSIHQLIELDNVERRLLKLSTGYNDYIDERVLWIRTGQWFGSDQLTKLSAHVAWISASKSWHSAFDAGWQDAIRHPASWILAAGMLLVWFCTRPFLKGLVRGSGILAVHPECRTLSPTMHAVGLTFLVASGWPLLVLFVGWRMDHSASVLPFVHAVGAGLLRAATFAIPLEILRIACMPGGLAEQHFGWSSASVARTRANLGWFIPAGVLLVGLVGMLEGLADEHRLDSLGRLTYLMFAALSTVFCFLVIRKSHFQNKGNGGESNMDTWSGWFPILAPRLAIAASLGLLFLGWSGYFYTALQLSWRLQQTTGLLVALLFLRATIRRWIALERRRMAILQDEELQTIADKGRDPGNSSHLPFLFPRWSWPDFRLNLTQIVSQMHRLLDTGMIALTLIGLWFVWADVTPALNILDRVTLWHTTVEQTVVSSVSGQPPTSKTEKVIRPITAANLGLAVLIVAIAVIAGRNVPGLVEVILLEHLSVDAGIRFATTYLVGNTIFIAGVCLGFGQIGIGWNNVQWLVAAASVGLGFGLQEIFSNFVSGVILLFERPMRVGDVITVGDTTGTVSRIRFRATTIVDGDRKELIVPNREFITGKLLNWTLSDRVNRVAVKVVVNGSNDPQRIRQLLLDIAARNPNLLKDPVPTANLEDMNGSLTFVLRAFLPSLDERSTAIHELYSSIHNRLLAEGIYLPRAA